MSTILRKRVAIIGTNGLPANYGGFETLVANIHEDISKYHSLTVYCSKHTSKNLKRIGNTRLFRIPLSANGFQSFLYDLLSILHAFFYSDVMIILGLGGGLALPVLSLYKGRIIYNPGGVETTKIRGLKLTSSLERSIKRSFDNGFFKRADTIILDNEAFFYPLLNFKSKLLLIEYGGESSNENYENCDLPFEHYDITVSRAQPDMKIHVVLKAYENVSRNLVVISNWNKSEYGRNLFKKYNNKFDNIYLHDAVYNKKHLNCLRRKASIYIHSHSLCGTAPSLVEAMSLGLAVLSYDTDTNRFTTENNCLYFSNERDLEVLLNTLENEHIKRVANNMKRIAENRYDWKIIASKYLNII